MIASLTVVEDLNFAKGSIKIVIKFCDESSATEERSMLSKPVRIGELLCIIVYLLR